MLTMPACRYRGCTALLDLTTAAVYCRPAHRTAEHRAVVADSQRRDAERIDRAVSLLRSDVKAAVILGDDAGALEALRMVESLLARP